MMPFLRKRKEWWFGYEDYRICPYCSEDEQWCICNDPEEMYDRETEGYYDET
jgi:carbonic anhydrase